MKLLADQIGTTQVHHASFLVETGKMAEVIAFFCGQLKWVEEENLAIRGEWGQARFIHPHTQPRWLIQLTEETEVPAGLPGIFLGTHLGILVYDADQAVR